MLKHEVNSTNSLCFFAFSSLVSIMDDPNPLRHVDVNAWRIAGAENQENLVSFPASHQGSIPNTKSLLSYCFGCPQRVRLRTELFSINGSAVPGSPFWEKATKKLPFWRRRKIKSTVLKQYNVSIVEGGIALNYERYIGLKCSKCCGKAALKQIQFCAVSPVLGRRGRVHRS